MICRSLFPPGGRCGRVALALLVLGAVVSTRQQGAAGEPAGRFEAVRRAVEDLTESFPEQYPDGPAYLGRLDALRQRAEEGRDVAEALRRLREEALTANPLLGFDELIVLKRKRGQLGLPTNHQGNSSLEQKGYDNEIAVLSPVRPGGRLRTLFRPEGTEFVGEIDLHFDADRLLFTMPNGRTWQIHEIGTDGRGRRQVSRDQGSGAAGKAGQVRFVQSTLRAVPANRPRPVFPAVSSAAGEGDSPIFAAEAVDSSGASLCMPRKLGQSPANGLRQVSREIDDVDNFDACYLPDGRIVFASTASYTAVPCWHGKERACSLFLMNADGSGVRQLGFDQDLTLHPAVLPNGQVIYSRWDYAGPMHMYLRPLMAMNPDGTGQRAVYGSGSYWPNSLFFPRGVPGAPGKVVAVLSGYHGVNRMGMLALLDLRRGWHEADGVVQLIAARDGAMQPVIRDALVNDEWPKFLHPYPLSEKYFLASGRPDAKSPWGIYLVDVFGNMVPLLVDPEHDFFEPIPLRPQPKPPAIPDRVDLTRDDAVVYLHDVYAGPGLAGVPRGTVRRLRVAAYHFGYPGLAGPDKIGCGGPWEVMRILGTVPVHDDGSAAFRVPANTPLTIQAMDADGQAVQLMRSWFTAMPGEVVSCVGCHETSPQTPVVRYEAASVGLPLPIEPWRGPPRGFSFEREVQPVLDRYCVGCHDGGPEHAGGALPDLRGRDEVEHYAGRPLTRLGTQRLHPTTVAHLGGNAVRYTPAYEALLPYVRRVGIEDDVHMLVPGEYHAGTSPLVQILRKGHHGVRLDAEAWDRLVTWIDLNAPCHGTWGEVAPVPEGADRRRWELQRLHGGPALDFEQIPDIARGPIEPILPEPPPPAPPVPELAGWPFDAAEAERRRAAGGATEKTVDLGGGVALRLVRIPAGRFVMGSRDGYLDEQPPAVTAVPRDFWMGAFEVTNEQFGRFDPGHRTGYFMQRYPGMDGPGLPLDAPQQPVLRVSWEQATAFCRWLSEQTGMHFTLPTEAQWEYACRAGTASPLSYGAVDADFSRYGNMADLALSRQPHRTGGLESNLTTPFIQGIVLEAAIGGDLPCDVRYDDGAVATAEVGSYAPNAWGLHDMHGNVAEWTRSAWRPYPYDENDGRNATDVDARRVVRGGSFVDRPARCRSAFRLSYPAWQRVHNVGFRVVAEAPPEGAGPGG